MAGQDTVREGESFSFDKRDLSVISIFLTIALYVGLLNPITVPLVKLVRVYVCSLPKKKGSTMRQKLE
jgi:hypothetical protein